MSSRGLVGHNPHDERLLAQVAPPDWRNPEPQPKYDLVVIGAGPAGLVAAAGAAGLGAKVALIEKGLLGGDCLNSGCVPSKALLAAARALHGARSAARLGVHAEASVDFPALMDRMREKRADLARHDSAKRFTEIGVDVYLGAGRFSGPRAVTVQGATLHFRKCLIATGARALVPEIPGLEAAGFHTNETIFALTELPRRLVVIGGGPIGCELAQAFRRFGSEVSILVRGRLLPKDHAEAVERVRRSFRTEGIEILEHTEVLSVRADAGARIVTVRSSAGEAEIHGDVLLVAAGRVLNVEGLGLEAVGIQREGRGLRVDDRLRTTNSAVFVAGDVAGGPQFTHAADAQARLVLRNAFFLGRGKASSLTVPWCTYTDPELAQVGLTPEAAAQQGIAVDAYRVELRDLDRGFLEEEEGFIQAITAKGTDKVLGFTLVGPHAGDLAGEAALLMATSGRLSTFDAVIHPYPTLAEAFKRLGGLYMKTRLTPLAARVFKRYFNLFR